MSFVKSFSLTLCVSMTFLLTIGSYLQATGHNGRGNYGGSYGGNYGANYGASSYGHEELDTSATHYESDYGNGYGNSYGSSYGGDYQRPHLGVHRPYRGNQFPYRGDPWPSREMFGPARFKRSTLSLSAEADKVLRAGSGLDTNNIPAVVDFVEKHKVGECLARVICELSNNQRAYGDSGVKLAQHLLKFRNVKHPKIGYYLQAMQEGARTKSFGTCAQHYNCPARSAEVVEVTNKILHLS